MTEDLTEHEMGSTASPTPDCIEGLELEGGDHPSFSTPRVEENERRELRSRR